ncbi:gp241 [Sphingomonas phage PAU]|uniref:gp241 n=1 Tax=Sphingomonas phage PAU TaxID=1150991 RepID=UPI00025733F7|nr:gp241 [Sphingomonas phage PAU]AFF28239.1 gp241 [Sphingomonas phage PAU]
MKKTHSEIISTINSDLEDFMRSNSMNTRFSYNEYLYRLWRREDYEAFCEHVIHKYDGYNIKRQFFMTMNTLITNLANREIIKQQNS